MDRNRRKQLVSAVTVVFMLLGAFGVMAQESDGMEDTQQEVSADTQEVSSTTATASDAASPSMAHHRGLNLWVMIKNGGFVLWVIIGLSVGTVMLAVFLFLTVTQSREIPSNFVKRAMSQIESGDLRGAYQMCVGRDELVANVLRAGLKVSGHDRYVIQDAMESEGERGATALWQRISYLNNVGVIAPLLGLLGTVWGMIGAFSAIALDDATGARSLTMAYSVSQAMITTAAGLILAIPAMVAYYILRGRVIKIIAQVEAQASEMVELLTRGREQ